MRASAADERPTSSGFAVGRLAPWTGSAVSSSTASVTRVPSGLMKVSLLNVDEAAAPSVRRRRGSTSGRTGHVAEARVAPLAAGGHVLGADRRELVGGDGPERGLHVDVVEPRGVAAEARGLGAAVGRAQRRELVGL